MSELKFLGHWRRRATNHIIELMDYYDETEQIVNEELTVLALAVHKSFYCVSEKTPFVAAHPCTNVIVSRVAPFLLDMAPDLQPPAV